MSTAGAHLGPYELLSSLGTGGMGEVFKARDTRLERLVAIKILNARLTGDPDAQSRFEREARLIAALNHPHICTLYDIGHENGTDFLVMELVQGETLAKRLERRALPVDQALQLASEIADALDAAHRRGIVHRDLKPANIMLTKTGLKLLDFGLAKLCSVAAGAVAGLSSAPTQSDSVADSGRILGTLPYMAPEQVEGKEVDARTDIFALGAVIYEMVTGRRAFESDSDAGLIAAVLRSEPPPVSRHQPMVPPALDGLVQTCLAKNPDVRWSAAHDIKLQLRQIAELEPDAGIRGAVDRRRRGRWPVGAALAAATVALGVTIGGIYFYRPLPDSPPMRWRVDVQPGISSSRVVAVSPDGRWLAFLGIDVLASGPVRLPSLWVRRLDAAEAELLPGTEGAEGVFWSPDSRFVGFFVDGKLKKIAVSGGSAETVCDAPDGVAGTWSRDGVIVFAARSGKGLYRVPAAGGSPTPVTTLDQSRGETRHTTPHFLPNGSHFLYRVSGTLSGIYVASLDSPDSKRVVAGGDGPVYASPGYLLFQRENALLAQRFDVERLELSGEPTVIDRAGRDATVSDTGVLVFHAVETPADMQLRWIDRAGRDLAPVGRPAYYQNPNLSPDGTRLAIGRMSNNDIDIWILDLASGTESRFTFEPWHEDWPVWSPDGSRIAFSASPSRGSFNLYVKPSSGAGKEELLLESKGFLMPTDWSPDGRFILYRTGSTRGDLWVLPLFGERKPTIVAPTDNIHSGRGQFSPDGRWIAYVSGGEVYVQAFPPSAGKWQISTAGGTTPRWRKDGKELFYQTSDGKLMAVPVNTGPAFEAGAAEVLFQPRTRGNHYAVTEDGQRFIFLYFNPAPPNRLLPSVIANWAALLNE